MQKYLVLNDKEEVEYILLEAETPDGHPEYSLFRSNGAEWCEDAKGTLITSVVDNGNELKFDHRYGKNIGYDEFMELLILLRFIKAVDDLKSTDNYKIVKVDSVATI